MSFKIMNAGIQRTGAILSFVAVVLALTIPSHADEVRIIDLKRDYRVAPLMDLAKARAQGRQLSPSDMEALKQESAGKRTGRKK